MIADQLVFSGEQPRACVLASGVMVSERPAVLPPVTLDGAAFTVADGPNGCVRLVDANGMGCGIFVNRQLAEATARTLSR